MTKQLLVLETASNVRSERYVSSQELPLSSEDWMSHMEKETKEERRHNVNSILWYLEGQNPH